MRSWKLQDFDEFCAEQPASIALVTRQGERQEYDPEYQFSDFLRDLAVSAAGTELKLEFVDGMSATIDVNRIRYRVR